MEYDNNYYSVVYGEDYIRTQLEMFENGAFEPRVNFVNQFAEEVLKGGRLLDLGCGVGTFAHFFAAKGFETVGLDISEESIKASEQLRQKLENTNSSFVLGSGADNLFKSESFDIIVAADIIEHLSPYLLDRTLANCFCWLKKGGCLVIHTHPTKYFYQTLTVASLALLPLFIIGKRYSEQYLKFLHYTLFNLAFLIVHQKTIDRHIESSGHCNPPHPLHFREIVEQAGLTVEKYLLKDQPVSRIRANHPKFKMLEKIIRKNDLLKSSIVVLVRKS